jgi:hypothetical protein
MPQSSLALNGSMALQNPGWNDGLGFGPPLGSAFLSSGSGGLDMTMVHRLMDMYEYFTREQVAVSPIALRRHRRHHPEALASAVGERVFHSSNVSSPLSPKLLKQKRKSVPDEFAQPAKLVLETKKTNSPAVAGLFVFGKAIVFKNLRVNILTSIIYRLAT